MYAWVLKDTSASKKAWLSRARAIQRVGYDHPGNHEGWVAADGKPLGKVEKEHLSKYKIPPNWSSPMVSSIPGSELVAEGIDGKGKKQPLYSTEHWDKVSMAKFMRISELNKHVGALDAKSISDMSNPNLSAKERGDAATAHLVLRTGFRPGGALDHAKDHETEQAYGASTLEARHIKVNGNTVEFNFNGKHLQAQKKILTDPHLAKYLKEVLPGLGPRDQVFPTTDKRLNAYIKKSIGDSQFKTKDLRTWNGTAVAKAMIAQEPIPKNEREFKAMQNRVADFVAEHLGNTRKVALKSYIDPSVWVSPKGMTAIEPAPKAPVSTTPGKKKVNIKP